MQGDLALILHTNNSKHATVSTRSGYFWRVLMFIDGLGRLNTGI
jgi:hypothetical protein